MTHDEFKNLVDTYGANVQRWPEETRSSALAFIENTANFANPLLAEARRLDQFLEDERVTPGTDMLKARILSSVSQLPSNQTTTVQAANSNTGMRYRAVAAMMAISFVLGFAGSNYMQSSSPDTGSALMVDNDWQELADDYGMSDVFEWVGQDTLP